MLLMLALLLLTFKYKDVNMIPRKHKNKLLLVTGVDDTFFSTNSRRHLIHGIELGNKIVTHIENTKDQYYGVVNLSIPTAYWKDVTPFDTVNKKRLINVVLNSNSLLNISNEVSLENQEGEVMLFNGNDLDFLVPSKDFEVHIVGVDVNGIYKQIIQELLEKGYKVYLYSDMIKRFKDSEPFFRSIRNRNFEYCASASALV